jgi:hypothetical protein
MTETKAGQTGKRGGFNKNAGIIVFIFACLLACVSSAFAGPVSTGSNNIIAYDPAEGVFVYKNADDKIGAAAAGVLKNIKKHRLGKGHSSEYKLSEEQAKNLISALGRGTDTASLKKATISVSRLKKDLMRLELGNKQDGQ